MNDRTRTSSPTQNWLRLLLATPNASLLSHCFQIIYSQPDLASFAPFLGPGSSEGHTLGWTGSKTARETTRLPWPPR